MQAYLIVVTEGTQRCTIGITEEIQACDALSGGWRSGIRSDMGCSARVCAGRARGPVAQPDRATVS